MINWAKSIRGLSGMSEAQYRQLEFETGIAFLEMMEEDSPELLAYMQRSRAYWQFWRRQFPKLAREYIKRNRIEVLRQMSPRLVRKRFQEYCRITLISDYGTRSYMNVALQAQQELAIQGKQQKV